MDKFLRLDLMNESQDQSTHFINLNNMLGISVSEGDPSTIGVVYPQLASPVHNVFDGTVSIPFDSLVADLKETLKDTHVFFQLIGEVKQGSPRSAHFFVLGNILSIDMTDDMYRTIRIHYKDTPKPLHFTFGPNDEQWYEVVEKIEKYYSINSLGGKHGSS